MTLSSWVISARIIIFIEGIGGIALNALLVFFLLRINLGSAAKLYRIACIVNAISNIYMSILIAVDINVPLMVGGGFVATLYGPLVFHLPRKFVDFLYVAFASETHVMWQLIPPPSLLQYLSLYKTQLSNTSKLLYAYSIPVIFHISTWIQCVNYVPSNEFRTKYQQIITDLHGSSSDECLIYGVPVVAEIRAKLRSLGNISSSKTAQMQKRFFLTQIAQVLLPLVIISIPTGIMAVAAFIGVDLNNFSFLYVYGFWISPIAQALLLLGFVMKSKRGNSVSGATTVTKISQYPSA